MVKDTIESFYLPLVGLNAYGPDCSNEATPICSSSGFDPVFLKFTYINCIVLQGTYSQSSSVIWIIGNYRYQNL